MSYGKAVRRIHGICGYFDESWRPAKNPAVSDADASRGKGKVSIFKR
jgi:hypothetical protein